MASNNSSLIFIGSASPTAFTPLDRNRVVHGGTAFITTAHEAWTDVPNLTITVPAGTYRIGYNCGMRLDNNGSGGMNGALRLIDVTNGNAIVPYSDRIGVTVGDGVGIGLAAGGAAAWDGVVTNSAPTTYRVQVIKVTNGGSPATAQNIFIEPQSHIEYVQQL